MKEIIHDRLKSLAESQVVMGEITDILENWDDSQLVIEKSTFDAINNSDLALNLSKDGSRLITKILDQCRSMPNEGCQTGIKDLTTSLEEAKELFQMLVSTSKDANEISHNLEQHVTNQRINSENIKDSVQQIRETLDQVVACAEFMLAEL